MTETIPADIMKAARIAFAQANQQSWWTNTREGETIIARAIMAHTARQEERIKELEAAIQRRKAIYEAKRDAADPFAEDHFCRRDLFNHAVEAFEYLEAEISGALLEQK